MLRVGRNYLRSQKETIEVREVKIEECLGVIWKPIFSCSLYNRNHHSRYKNTVNCTLCSYFREMCL
jgi:hypothetical protein